jgi:TIR domain-containing protein/uncharacterized protein DUF3298
MQTLESSFVFLSYASPDRDRVLAIYDFLSANGVGVWMDARRILPGQNWEFEIRRALDAAAAVVVFISQNSVDRTGYVQRELRMVIDKLHERPVHRIYAVPVILNPEVPVPDALKHLHCLTLAGPHDQASLLQAVRTALGKVEQTREVAQMEAEIEWTFGSWKEAWDGVPGYEAEISWPIYRSIKYPLVSQIGDAIRSEVQLMLAQERAVKLHQLPDLFSFSQAAFSRTNALSVTCENPLVKHNVLSQQLDIYWYGAGAVHGNYGFSSWVFVLDPLVRIERLATVFKDADAALATIQTEARARLLAELEQREEKAVADEDRLVWTEGIVSGTADWDAFGNFGFADSGLVLLFPPYQVASYASGSLSVLIPYDSIFPLLHRPYADALGLSWMDYEKPMQWEWTGEL